MALSPKIRAGFDTVTETVRIGPYTVPRAILFSVKTMTNMVKIIKAKYESIRHLFPELVSNMFSPVSNPPFLN